MCCVDVCLCCVGGVCGVCCVSVVWMCLCCVGGVCGSVYIVCVCVYWNMDCMCMYIAIMILSPSAPSLLPPLFPSILPSLTPSLLSTLPSPTFYSPHPSPSPTLRNLTSTERQTLRVEESSSGACLVAVARLQHFGESVPRATMETSENEFVARVGVDGRFTYVDPRLGC